MVVFNITLAMEGLNQSSSCVPIRKQDSDIYVLYSPAHTVLINTCICMCLAKMFISMDFLHNLETQSHSPQPKLYFKHNKLIHQFPF